MSQVAIADVWGRLVKEFEEMGGPYIRTYSGIKFTIFNPKPEMIIIEDIAHALSQLCRYGGHCSPFYSVARHSIIASYLVEEKYALDALCHDFSEAYVIDLPRPIKQQIPEYTKLEDKIYLSIAQKYNLSFPIPPAVHKIDRDMIGYEWDYFMEKKPKPELLDFYKKYFLNSTPEETKNEFLARFHYLMSNKPVVV